VPGNVSRTPDEGLSGCVVMDVSCLAPRPLTGVGYYTRDLIRAFLAGHPEWRMRLFASSARGTKVLNGEFNAGLCAMRCPTRIKNVFWTRFDWPPIEWMAGTADIVHGAFHLLPASRKARRVVTVFDLSALRVPGSRTASNFRLHMRLLRHAVARADALIAISESCRADLVELLRADPNRIHVVYGGVSLGEFASPPDTDRLAACRKRFGINKDYFIHLGTLEPRKNVPRLLEAYARVRARYGDCPMLVLAGKAGWMYDDVFQTIARLHLEESVVHTGYLDRADAVSLLRGAFACVYPSLYEGFGLPALEAMAARTPVLTSRVSSLPEIVGDTGILVEPERVESIEAGLVELLEHRAEALKRTDAASDRARRFTWERSADALANVYRRVLEGSPS